MSGVLRSEQVLLGVKDAVMRVFDTVEKLDEAKAKEVIHSTGFESLDRICGGLPPADLSLAVARRFAIASTFASQVAVKAALRGSRVLVIYARYPVQYWMSRSLLSEARVVAHRFHTDRLSELELARVALAAEELSDADISLCFQRDLDALCGQARRWRQEHDGPALILVDGLERLRCDPDRQGREPDFSRIGSELKALAQELDLPLLAGLGLGPGLGLSRFEGDSLDLDEIGQRGDLDVLAALVLMLVIQWDEGDGGIVDGDGHALIMIPNPVLGMSRSTFLTYHWDTNRFRNPDEPLLQHAQKEKDAPGEDPVIGHFARSAFVACSGGHGVGGRLADLLHQDLGPSFTEQELLEHPRLREPTRDELRGHLEQGLAAAWLGQVFLRKREEDGRWHWADLSEDGLLSMERSRLMEVLFDGIGERDGFSYAALLTLLRKAKRLISWGDGALSNAHWLIRAPEALGMLQYLYDTENLGRRGPPRKGYAYLLKLKEQQPDRIGGQDSQGDYLLERSGTLLDRNYVNGLLAVLGTSVADLKGVELLSGEREDSVLLRWRGEIVGALMPLKAEVTPRI